MKMGIQTGPGGVVAWEVSAEKRLQRQWGHSGGGGQSRLTANSTMYNRVVGVDNGFENKALKSLHTTQGPAAR